MPAHLLGGLISTPPPISGNGGFNLIFDEEFGTTVAEGLMFAVSGDHAAGLGAYADNWGAQTYLTTYGKAHNTGDHYGINNISVVSGIAGATGNCMQMRLIPNDGTGKRIGANPYPNTSGTPGANSSASGQLYGAFEVRSKTSGTPGWKRAWELWPASWVWDNEVDFPEDNLDGHIGGNVHKPGDASVNAASYSNGTTTSTDWHITRTEWTPAGVRFLLDGVQVLSTSVHPAELMFLLLQTENSLSTPQPISTGFVWVDWVKVYSYS